ncbi:MAG: class I SAM-dependent methyltransferase [Deltaproteobacteria bacterium]|nr:class I SAM-dependent methyltransferase [Deltaproteobacteria bacterium]
MGSMHMNLNHHLNLLWRFDRGLCLKEVVLGTVREGDVVVDAGCGTGVLSLWAAKAGARKVYAVDMAANDVGEALAEANGVKDKIAFVRGDLAGFHLPDGGRCDVLLAMVYFNDPRRDAAQMALTFRLRERLLRAGGAQIPNRVRYTAQIMDWPTQDVGERLAEIDRRVSIMEDRYDLKLGPMSEAAKRTPDGSWFPSRLESGAVERRDARILSERITLSDVDYAGEFHGYPDRLRCRIKNPGIATAVLFTQELYAGTRLVFANESVSWLESPRRVESECDLELALDRTWFTSNRIATDVVPPASVRK